MSEYQLGPELLGLAVEKALKDIMSKHGGWHDKFDLYRTSDMNKFLMVVTYNDIEKYIEIPAAIGMEFDSKMNEIEAWVALAQYTKKRAFAGFGDG